MFKSPFSRLTDVYMVNCKCGNKISVKEYIEPAINDPGIVEVRCHKCGEIHHITLSTNVDGCDVYGATLVDYEYR